MFRAPGHCYVYLIYGMYYCVNVVSEPEGCGAAVLVRAVEPEEGLETMAQRRGLAAYRIRDFARGPGRLCCAFGIERDLSGAHFTESPQIWLCEGAPIAEDDVDVSGRIGIRVGTELPLRFSVRGSRFVSRGERTRA